MRVPSSVEEAVRLQVDLAPSVVRSAPPGFAPRTAAGLDVAYAIGSPFLAAAAVTVSVATGEVLESATALGEAEFPYVPGLFAFRELPTLLRALSRLTVTPDLLLADGHGLAHPRRFGLACHLGVETGLPSIGVAKTSMGPYVAPATARGARSPLLDGDEEVGAVLRTQRNVKPVFVSIGHLVDLDTACAQVIALTPRYRLPETTRAADHLSRQALHARVFR
ncbi:endonuclease V [Actinophytocola sp.]|uniref:endonuclease V n=1 Tax=Actinophytocola sp. TaxID=1872138 RepID=UPI003899F091